VLRRTVRGAVRRVSCEKVFVGAVHGMDEGRGGGTERPCSERREGEHRRRRRKDERERKRERD